MINLIAMNNDQVSKEMTQTCLALKTEKVGLETVNTEIQQQNKDITS